MKNPNITFLFVLLMSMISNKAFAYDIRVSNEDGVSLCYNYINDGKELELTYFSMDAIVKNYSAEVINIPETVTYMNRDRPVTRIGNCAFYNARRLTSVSIPKSVTSLGDYCFEGCRNLSSLTIYNSHLSYGKDIFANGGGYNLVVTVCVDDYGDFCNNTTLGRFSSVKLIDKDGKEISNYVIPEDVTSIGSYAFFGCKGLTSITIPNSVTSIGNSAFYNCYGLTSITIPNSVTRIEERALKNCTGLASITIGTGLTDIGKDAFFNCDNLTSVHISDIAAWCNISFTSNPLSYAHHLYLNDEEVTDLVIPEGVTKIGYGAFSGCSTLTSVTFPNSLTKIEYGAFSGCSTLTSVTFPNSLTSIGYLAFSGCYGLTSVTFPNSLTSIEYEAFSGCARLVTVISFIENPFKINSFDNDHYMNTSLFVPVGTIDKYKKAEGWKNFIWMEEGIPTGIKEEKISNDEKSWYSLDGVRLESVKKGINIIRHADGSTKKVLIK